MLNLWLKHRGKGARGNDAIASPCTLWIASGIKLLLHPDLDLCFALVFGPNEKEAGLLISELTRLHVSSGGEHIWVCVEGGTLFCHSISLSVTRE
jgi:hypothetical protein